MNITRCAIFIDGAYLDKTNIEECGSCKFDYRKFASKIANGIDILRTYYYNCLPHQQTPPTPDDARRFSQAQKFHSALRALPRFEVREGLLVYRGISQTGSPIYIQKGIDIQLGVDLVLLAAKQQISHAAIIAGDSDLIPAICAAKNEGVLIHLFHGSAPHRKLIEVSDERTIIDRAYFKDILFKP